MTNETTQPMTTDINPNDPRYGFAMATAALHPLIAAAETQLDLPTPCEDYTVKELLEHLVLVMRRAAALGQGEHWTTVQQVAQESGWGDDFRTAAHEVRNAWDDPAKLGVSYEVPWGEFPGAVVLLTYTGELAVHGWDLATATGEPFAIDDQYLAGALMAAKAIPVEGRDDPEMPFDPPTEVPSDATIIEQMAALTGRTVTREARGAAMEPTYTTTLISVAEDCPVTASKVPQPRGAKPTVAMLQHAMIAEEPFVHTMGDVLFGVWLRRQHPDGEAAAMAEDEVEVLREQFFAKDQPCLRTSPLAKTHGWGFVFDGEGRVALCPMESDEYAAKLDDDTVVVRPAMRSKRAR